MSSSLGTPPALYAALGVPPTISPSDLARHFKRLSLELHPDRAAYRQGNGASNEAEVQQRYQRITEAYKILSDPLQRAAYDTKHSVNFSSRVSALREAVERKEETSVMPETKRHRPEVAADKSDPRSTEIHEESTSVSKDTVNKSCEAEEEEEDEEYIPE